MYAMGVLLMNNEQLIKLKDIVNEELTQGKSLKAVLKKYGIQKKDFSRIKYAYNPNTKQFEAVGQSVGPKVGHKDKGVLSEISIDVLHNTDNEGQKESDKVKEPISKALVDEGLNSHPVGQLDSKNYINNNLDVLAEIIENYKNNKVVDTSNIVVELPTEDDKNFKASVRINDIVWNRFKSFCKEHKQFTQKELASQALLDYIEKYDKKVE